MRSLLPVLILAFAILTGGSPAAAEFLRPADRARIDALLTAMTLEEKAGQLNLLSGNHAETGPYITEDLERDLKAGRVGGVYNAYGADYVARLQRMAVEQTRLGIPLLVGLDVLHGYRTIFPVPLGQAASFDVAAIERAERVAASEASAAGVDWVFAPMVDLARDPRWGRIVEGNGESAWLGARIAGARVRGFQGGNLAAPDSVAACPKHFAGYGAAEGGRDYAGSDLSERALRESFLPPFKAAIDAGALCLMSAFSTVDGIPGTVNRWMLRDLLRDEWGFSGVAISDFGSVDELVVHGVAEDPADATRQALLAGIDMDMQSSAFAESLPALVREGLVPEPLLDEAVRRVLALKAALGLFDNPWRRAGAGREARALFTPENRAASLDLARKSLVLLKNEDRTLPFGREIRRLALIGPLGSAEADTLGPWAADGKPHLAITLAKGLEALLGRSTAIERVAGGSIDRATPEEIAAAVAAAGRADAVVLALGERSTMTGEAASRTRLGLPGDQLALARAVLATGRPTALVLFNGRPLAIPELAAEAPAIVEAWFPGSMGGQAVAELLFGEIEPRGRLPVTFPRSPGQVPIFHDARPTGRPASHEHYSSRYIDEDWRPLYPFGWGLTYTEFAMAAPILDREVLGAGETATVRVEVTNTGNRRGTALVQLYVRDIVASVSRPVRELRGYAPITLAPGASGTVELAIGEAELAFWDAGMRFRAEPGTFDIMTGPHALDTQAVRLRYAPDERRVEQRLAP